MVVRDLKLPPQFLHGIFLFLQELQQQRHGHVLFGPGVFAPGVYRPAHWARWFTVVAVDPLLQTRAVERVVAVPDGARLFRRERFHADNARFGLRWYRSFCGNHGPRSEPFQSVVCRPLVVFFFLGTATGSLSCTVFLFFFQGATPPPSRFTVVGTRCFFSWFEKKNVALPPPLPSLAFPCPLQGIYEVFPRTPARAVFFFKGGVVRTRIKEYFVRMPGVRIHGLESESCSPSSSGAAAHEEAEEQVAIDSDNRDQIMRSWVEQCRNKSKTHHRWSYFFLVCHGVTGVLSVMSGCTAATIQVRADEPQDTEALVLTMVSLAMSATSLLFRFPQLASDHYHFSYIYAMLQRRLSVKLCEMQHQPTARDDVFIQQCIEEWYQIEKLAPYPG